MAGLLGPRNDNGFEPSGEINVTPLIDVMLVLLLVFMIAAPISTSNVPIELPGASSKTPPPPEHPIVVSIRNDLSIYLADRRIDGNLLLPELKRAGATGGSTIFLRIDKRVAYGDTLGVLDALRSGGFVKVALVGLTKAEP